MADVGALTTKLDGCLAEGYALRVNLAKPNSSPKPQSNQNAKFRHTNHSPTNMKPNPISSPKTWNGMSFITLEEETNWLNGCFVGFIHDHINAFLLQEKFFSEGIRTIKVTPMGGNLVLLKGSDMGEIPAIIEALSDIVQRWFSDIRPWSPSYVGSSRLTWIKCLGVPLHAWNEKFFSDITVSLGKFCMVDDSTANKARLDFGRILIKTSIPETINRVITIQVDDQIFKIRLIEECCANGEVKISTDRVGALQSFSDHSDDGGNAGDQSLMDDEDISDNEREHTLALMELINSNRNDEIGAVDKDEDFCHSQGMSVGILYNLNNSACNSSTSTSACVASLPKNLSSLVPFSNAPPTHSLPPLSAPLISSAPPTFFSTHDQPSLLPTNYNDNNTLVCPNNTHSSNLNTHSSTFPPNSPYSMVPSHAHQSTPLKTMALPSTMSSTAQSREFNPNTQSNASSSASSDPVDSHTSFCFPALPPASTNPNSLPPPTLLSYVKSKPKKNIMSYYASDSELAKRNNRKGKQPKRGKQNSESAHSVPSLSDSNIMACNNLAKSRTFEWEASAIWSLGMQIGIVGKGNDNEIISKLQELAARDFQPIY